MKNVNILKCVDANQKWDVDEAIDWMKELVPYKPHWIEELTSPDDVLGHARIAQVQDEKKLPSVLCLIFRFQTNTAPSTVTVTCLCK